MRPVRAAARALLGALFVTSGARTLARPDAMVPRAKLVTDRLGPALERVSPRVPTDPRSLVLLNAAAQVAGGLLLVRGRFSRPAAAVLAGSLVPTTLAGHPFWTYGDATERRAQQVQFMKNMGLLGGLLLAAADTQGRPGLRWRTTHAVGHTRRSISRAARTTRRAAHTARREAKLAAVVAGAARRLPG
jgi:uncharacterized membrane protein YphA (DoxX/SURF4 family)